MAQNDMSDEATVLQMPQVFFNTSGIRKDNGICLYQFQDYIFTHTRLNSQWDTFIHSFREDTSTNYFFQTNFRDCKKQL